MGWMNKLLLLVLLLLSLTSIGWAQCTPTPNSGACFKAYDATTGQELPFYLCVGRPVRLRDCSGKGLNPAQIYYRQSSAIVCSGFTDTTTTFTPTAPGVLVITQNTQGPQGGSQGIIFSRNFEVKSTPQPTFTVTTCTPGFVQVTVTDTNYDQYFVQVGNDAPVLAARNTAVTYPATNGPASVTVIGRYNQTGICTGSATRNFTPLPAPQRPTLRSLAVQGSTVQLQFGALQPEYQYSLQVADAGAPGGYRTVAAVPSSLTSFTLNAAPLPGCYRLLLQDNCQPSVVSSSSFVVCSVALTGTTQNGRNLLSWASGGTGGYTLTRTDAAGTVLTLPVPAGTTQYTDTAVTCGSVYRYQVSLTSGSTLSTSDEVAITTSSGAAPATPRLYATFNLRNQVELTAMLARSPTGGQITYLRNGQELRTTPQRTLRDSLLTPSPADLLCYTVRFQDACGNRSTDSAPVCPVLLEARAANDEGTTIRLTWTALRGPDAAASVSYRVLTLSPTNTVLRSIPVTTGLTYLDLQPPQDQQVVRYRVEATGGGLAAASYSNVASVARQVKLFVPTAFTPNGDGLNDVLELKGRFLDNFRFTIIDRNGQQVFQATSRAQTWDGRIGSAAPVPGAYAWRFEATDQSGKRTVQNGSITIIR